MTSRFTTPPPRLGPFHFYFPTRCASKNVFDRVGITAHEAFIFNAARGRLDVYNFDVWNMHQCQCVDPQPHLKFCTAGFPRWTINAITFTRNVSARFGSPIPPFDEPVVSIGWPRRIPPHRVGMVGEALFVHGQVRGAGLPQPPPPRPW